jgi:hypothetical protein
MKKHKVPLLDAQKKDVDAWLIEGIGVDEIIEADREWRRIKKQHQDLCKQNGLPCPEHSHWNWENKADNSALSDMVQTRFAIVYQDEIQGLMLVERMTQYAKLLPDKGKPIVYIKFLEAAPWNLALYTDSRKFFGVGRVFLRIAVDFSVGEGCDGRVGLHALPQAEAFYRTIGMTELDYDPTHENLRHFEFTCKQAQEYLERK